MQPSEAILVVLLVVLIVVVMCQGRGMWKGGGGCNICPSGCGSPRDGKKGTFAAGAPAESPYTPLGMQQGALVGARHDAFNQDHAYSRLAAADLGKHYRSWAASPRDLEEAQRAAWFESTANGTNTYYDTETGGDPAKEMMGNHTPGPSINYQDTLVDLVADPRMRAQQANWHSEVAPKSQTSMKVDTIDEAAAMSEGPRTGITAFRFAGSKVGQHNPLFITDQGPEDHAVHASTFVLGM